MNDRREPLPGLVRLPSFLYRKLSPRGRRRARIGGLLLLVLAVAGAIVMVPRLADIREDNAERAREEAAQARVERRRELIAEQRPRFGSTAAASRAGKVRAVEAAITADANRRVRAGALETEVMRTDCHGPGAPRRQLLACTAVTSVIPANETTEGGVVGYPFRAQVDLQTGRFALCKISGRAGEGSLGIGVTVPLPPACGG